MLPNGSVRFNAARQVLIGAVGTDLVDLLSTPEEEERRHRPDAVLLRDGRDLVDVDLGNEQRERKRDRVSSSLGQINRQRDARDERRVAAACSATLADSLGNSSLVAFRQSRIQDAGDWTT
jgi:hypothetical protein